MVQTRILIEVHGKRCVTVSTAIIRIPFYAPVTCLADNRGEQSVFFFSSRRRHTSCLSDWSSDVCSSDLGPKWWTKNYRLWDMAAGTGNLEWFLPADAYKSIYLSTLHHEDVQHCKRVFPGATVFQYDYLNDDVETVFDDQSLFDAPCQRPANLLRDLYDPNIKWIIFINPPFATSQTAG